jgi:hypothetical protein
MKKLILTTAILLLTISSLFSQTNEVGKKYIYEFRDGTTIIGTFDREEQGNIYIKDMQGKEVYIPSVMIAQKHEVTDDNLRNGEYWFPNLHDTRYFFAPTGFGLRKGEGYFNNLYYMFWQAQFGITDEFSIGGGTSFLGMPATLNAKYSFNIQNDINMALGYFWVGNLFWKGNDRTFVSMPFAVVTKGSKENNITLGLGFNLDDNWLSDRQYNPNTDSWEEREVSPIDRFTLNFGATFRTSRRFAFIAEAWVFDLNSDEVRVMGGPGIRYFRKVNRVTAKNGAGAKTFDFQLLMNPESEGIIPMFGASQKF